MFSSPSYSDMILPPGYRVEQIEQNRASRVQQCHHTTPLPCHPFPYVTDPSPPEKNQPRPPHNSLHRTYAPPSRFAYSSSIRSSYNRSLSSCRWPPPLPFSSSRLAIPLSELTASSTRRSPPVEAPLRCAEAWFCCCRWFPFALLPVEVGSGFGIFAVYVDARVVFRVRVRVLKVSV